MAYSNYIQFRFASRQGAEYYINILKDNYTGSVLVRNLGGTPSLRRDKSDNVCGTSLEIPAECQVDAEFATLYTTGAKTYRVDLKDGSSNLVWQGFVTPELYSEPDIAPPYDVKVTATDGLGELKRVDFTARGSQTLENHLEYLLAYTGLSLDLMTCNDICTDTIAATALFSSIYVDMDHMAGENCYDVLQALLRSLNATITQYAGTWLIVRETGLTISGSNVTAQSGGSAVSIPIQRFGSAATYGWWPVGQLSSEIVPAKKSVVLTAENHYKENLLGTWTATGSATYDSTIGAWLLPAASDGITQFMTFSENVMEKLVLTIKIRCVGDSTTTGKINVLVMAAGTNSVGSVVYYLTNANKTRRGVYCDFSWTSSVTYCSLEVQAPSSEDTDDDYVELQLVIPFFYNNARSYFRASQLQVNLLNSDGTYPIRVYDVALTKYDQVEGYQQTVNINNSARGEASDVDLTFSRVASDNNYTGITALQTGILASSSGKVTAWKSSVVTTSMDYMSLISRDYALGIAAARVQKSGTLNVPTTFKGLPPFMSDGSTNFVMQTCTWRIFEDELDVEMVSIPNAALSVDTESVKKGESNNASNHQQAESSGGGGSGSGTVTSVGMTVPTGFAVSGSPITGAGTLALSLASGYMMITTSQYQGLVDFDTWVATNVTSAKISAWDNAASAAHSHSNKSALDTISAQDIANWNQAATDDHSHDNKAELDEIESGDVTNWNTAYGWGDHSAQNYIKNDGATSRVKKIILCTSYPATSAMEDGALYIKVASL